MSQAKVYACIHFSRSVEKPPPAEEIGLVNTKFMHAASAIDPRLGMIDKPRFRDSILGAAQSFTQCRKLQSEGPEPQDLTGVYDKALNESYGLDCPAR